MKTLNGGAAGLININKEWVLPTRSPVLRPLFVQHPLFTADLSPSPGRGWDLPPNSWEGGAVDTSPRVG